MDLPTRRILIADARRALDGLRLADALGICTDLGLDERVRPTREAYLLMLDYLGRGTEDATRGDMYRRFIRETHEALDHAERENVLQNPSGLYALSQRHPVDAFDRTFTLPALSPQQAGEITASLDDDATPHEDRCLTLSALTLGLLYFFDARKMRILMRYLHHADTPLAARALVGAALAQIYWHERLKLYPELTALWRGVDVLELQLKLLLTLDTRKIERSIREDIMPDMMKQFGKFKTGTPTNPEDMASQLQEAMTAHPEWSAGGTETHRMAEKLQQLAAWQQQGADVYLGWLGSAKRHLPFFRTTSNWFRPYGGKHSALLHSGLCDSDKWTLEQAICAMPAPQRDLLEKLGAAGEGLPADEGPAQLSAIASYLQDVYRFFHLHPQHDASVNPFRRDLLLPSYGVFDDRIDNPETLQRLGHSCLKHGDCRQAIRYLERADLLKSDDAWTLGRLAFCHRALGENEKALYYYKEVERVTPEDTRNLCRIGECHIQRGDYEEAFRYLYKANYLSDDAPQTVRALGWCSLMAGQPEQAETFYAKLLTAAPTPADWLNAGHAALCCRKPALAVDRYVRAGEAARLFDDDAQQLHAWGFSAEYLAWITDMVALRQKK